MRNKDNPYDRRGLMYIAQIFVSLCFFLANSVAYLLKAPVSFYPSFAAGMFIITLVYAVVMAVEAVKWDDNNESQPGRPE